MAHELSADDVNFDRTGPEIDQKKEYDDEYYQQLYQQYLSMYEYYLNSDFDEYDYTGYTDT